MADIGSRVTLYREEIKNCILSDSVLSRLPDIIPRDDVIHLRQLYESDRPRATGQMLTILEQSTEPGKWKMFIDALKEAEYPHLVYLLETSSRLSQNYDHERKLVQLFWPKLVNRIDPAEFVHHLYSGNVINMEDLQVINSKQNNVGQQAGAIALLERIQCRQKPEYWYQALLGIMMDMSLDDLVQEMEPDFYNQRIKSKEFKSSTVGYAAGGSCMDTDELDACGSIRVNVMSGFGEACKDENNLSAPDIQQDSQISSSAGTDEEFYSINNSITQAKKLLYETKMNVRVDDNLETKPLNVNMTGQNVVSEEEFHDAVEDHGIEEWYQPKSASKKLKKEADNTDEPKAMFKEADSHESDDSDDNNLSSDDDFWTEENIGSNPMENLKLRKYQLELAENALKGDNTIICAETGTGKTWVALHIVKKHLERLQNGKVVFMAKTGTLIKQQADRFKKLLPEFETILLTGDSENSGMLFPLMEGFQIFCMTPQILLNNLDRNSDSSVSSFTLLLFDECHHTKKDDPYNKVMRRYLMEKFDSPSLELPQIIGLTASLGVGKAFSDEDAKEYILGICANLDAKNLSTVELYKDELKKHVNLPKESAVTMQARKNDPCKSILKLAISHIESKLEDLTILNSRYVEIMNKCPSDKEAQEYSKWTQELKKIAKLSDDDYEETRNISTCARYLSVLTAALEVNSLLLTNDVHRFLSDRLGNDLKHKSKLTAFETEVLKNLTDDVKKMRAYAKDVENPNVRLLSDTLRNMLEEKGDESRAMVFVKQRATCKRLAEFLDENLADIKVRALYGKENTEDEEGMTESRQNDTVERFRSGEYKVLVATSVGSEGIDVPDCNIVLSYNYAGNEIQKIQMAGRSRKKGGTTLVLGNEKIVLQDTINAYKAAMMYRAMKLIKLLPQHIYNKKLKIHQKTDLEQFKVRRGVEEYLLSKKTDETPYDIKCGHCNAFACHGSDIRILKHSQHIVVDRTFSERIIVKPHRSPKTFEGMTKTSKVFCKKCPLDWGILLDYHGLSLCSLKLACLKFVNTETGNIREYKKWIEVPFRPPTTEYEDLVKLFESA